MLELTLGALRPSDKFDLKVSTSKLLVRAIFPYATAAGLADFKVTAAGCKITATRFTQDKGNKSLIENMSLYDLAEIAAQNEGYISLIKDTVNNKWVATFSVELSNAGAVRLSSRDFVTVQVAAAGSFDSLAFYSHSAAEEFDEHLKYSPIACNANAAVKFNCVSAYGIAVPSNTVKLSLTYMNGITQDIEHDELPLISPDVNEIVAVVNGAVVSVGEWRFFPLPTADRGIITLQADGFAYLLSNKNYE